MVERVIAGVDKVIGTHGSFSVLMTGDGSPSLRGEGEPMHHLGGAYTETQYIYGDALRKLATEQELKEWKVIVVGLGLGYIELLVLAEALKNQKKIKILSYEIKQELVDSFLSWLKGEESYQAYDSIYAFFERDYPELTLSSQNLKSSLWELYVKGDWVIKKGLDMESRPQEPYHAILFDAFSGKSTPELWTEEFLKCFLQDASALPCVFSTYACTGILKRTLHSAGFLVEKRSGFLGKRHSTIAIKSLEAVGKATDSN